MFKKRGLAKNPSSRRRDDEMNDADNKDHGDSNASQQQDHSDDDDDDVAQRIQHTKKKRQLLTDLQYKRGVNASELLHVPHDSEAVGEYANRSAPVDDNDADDDKTQGIWAKKHKQAMEDFIQQSMGGGGSDDTQKNKKQQQQSTDNSSHLPADEQELYQSLAAKARELAGKTTDTTPDTKEADTGMGGALLAGTGIAEVILPPSSSAPVVSATREAAVKNNKNALPTSWASHHAVPSRFAQPSVRTMDLPQQFLDEHIKDATSTTTKTPSTGGMQPPKDDAEAVDNDRVGFEATRRGASAVHRKPLPPKQQATDDQVYKKFVGHVREQQHKKK